MRSINIFRIFMIVSLPLVCGCDSNNKGKIEGTHWVSQSTSFQGKVVSGGTLKLSFYKHGTMSYKAGSLSFEGKYTLGMGDTVVFHLNKELAGRKTHHEKCIIVEDRLTVIDRDGTKINFTKKQ